MANNLSTGELDVLTLTSHDRLSYVRAIEALKATGVPLEMAAMQFAEAHKLLEGGSLLEAVRFYLKQNPHRLPKKLVPELVEDLLLAKQADGMSAVYLKDLKGRLGRFARGISGADIVRDERRNRGFSLRGLKDKSKDRQKAGKVVSGRSRNNYRRGHRDALLFCRIAGAFAERGWSQVDSVAVAREAETEIEIFTPAELMRGVGAC